MTDAVTSSLAGALHGRYAIERELGRGGMATVYLARDLKHKRQVALKVLDPRLGAILGGARFTREIETTAQLQHPHILPVFDSGETAGLLWYTMPFVEGESLRDRLRRERQLPIEAALQVTREVGDALAYAHRKGVIHRDIKPENILLGEAHALVTDFGIARALNVAGEENMTGAGFVLGTPAYMSPEQVIAKSELDGRSDIYSLACVVFEMLTGEPPFSGPTSQAIMTARCSEPPRRVRALRMDVPQAVDDAVNRALAPMPAERFPTATRFVQALAAETRPADTVTRPVAQPLSDERSIAVIPFVNLSPEENEYFGDGMTDEIINALTQVKGLRVAARSACFAFKAKDWDVRDIGRRLNVQTLLQGSVRKVGSRVRLTAQLVDAMSGYQSWSQTYERTIQDVFALQEELSRAIVEALALTLAPSQSKSLVKRYTDDVEAYNLYLTGRYYWNKRTEDAVRRGIRYFSQAIDKDPAYALAYAGIADSYIILSGYGALPPTEAMPRAKAAALQALELDEQLAEAHASLGHVQANFDWAFADAAKTFERALQLKPQYAVAHHWYAFNLLASGRGTEALAEARLAEQLDPLSLIIATAVAVHFYYAREYDHAILQCRKVLEMDPHFHTARSVMAGAYQQRGMHAEAIAELEQAMSVVGRSPALLALLGYTYGCLGRNLEFESVLRELGEPAGQRYVPPLYVATVYAGCGDIREALHWLELAYRDRDETLVMLGLEPRFDPLRADPAFTALVTRVRSGSSQAGEAVISG